MERIQTSEGVIERGEGHWQITLPSGEVLSYEQFLIHTGPATAPQEVPRSQGLAILAGALGVAAGIAATEAVRYFT
jgi:hypothetical protein